MRNFKNKERDKLPAPIPEKKIRVDPYTARCIWMKTVLWSHAENVKRGIYG